MVYVLYRSLYGVCIVKVLIWCMYCTGPYMVHVLYRSLYRFLYGVYSHIVLYQFFDATVSDKHKKTSSFSIVASLVNRTSSCTSKLKRGPLFPRALLTMKS